MTAATTDSIQQTLADFVFNVNSDGWGPRGVPEHFRSMPFQPFNRADKIGKVADWTGTIYNERRFGRDSRYTQQYFTGQVGTQYAFDQSTLHDEGVDSGKPASAFQLVDTTKQQKSSQQRGNKIRQMQNARRLIQKEREKRKEAGYLQTMAPGRYGPQRGYNRQQWRPGGHHQYQRGSRLDFRGGGTGGKSREPSVQVKPDWEVLEELDFPRLQKLYWSNVSDGHTIEGQEYGALEYYDKAYDRLTARNAPHLLRTKREFFRVTTTEDPVIQKLSRSPEYKVFGTDVLITALMCCTRSVYSWDIVVHRVGDKLFFDKRSKSDIDYPTVSETSLEPPQDEGNHINSPKKLMLEAVLINCSFSQQVLRSTDEKLSMKNPNIPFLDNKHTDDQIKPVSVAYKYRKWDLGDGITMVCRCEHDGVMVGPNGENLFLTIRAFNEWDSKLCGGIEWSSRIETQKGAVLATELKNNSCKLARWTLQALLAGSDYLKFGYVSRVHMKDSSNHNVLTTQQFRPAEFANQINLNVDNAFGILRVIVDLCLKQPVGKYILLKDPNKPVVRLYKVPPDSFDSDVEEEDDDEDDEEDDAVNT